MRAQASCSAGNDHCMKGFVFGLSTSYGIGEDALEVCTVLLEQRLHAVHRFLFAARELESLLVLCEGYNRDVCREGGDGRVRVNEVGRDTVDVYGG